MEDAAREEAVEDALRAVGRVVSWRDLWGRRGCGLHDEGVDELGLRNARASSVSGGKEFEKGLRAPQLG